MNKKNILKKAAVLLMMILMIATSGIVAAKAPDLDSRTTTREENSCEAPQGRGLVWDNVVGVHGAYGGIIVATQRTEGCALPADDFQLDTEREVDSLFWQGGYFQCQNAEGQKDYHWDWRVIFWNDVGDGSHPGTEIYNESISDASITRSWWYNYTHTNGNTYWVANYSAALPEPITFSADTTYWITILAIQGTNAYPQGCWARHNNTDGGIKLHEAVIKAAWWTYPEWTNISVLVTDHLPHDLNYQLFGPGGDTTPPTTTCDLDGEMSGEVYITPVTVTLTATDAESEVNYTKYKLDDGTWTTYSSAFVVAEKGEHTLYYYSADTMGNIETEKSTTFTIQYPIEISVKGGLGVSATITNSGTTNLTNISWTISLDGALIFLGKTKSDTIPSLAVGDSVTVRDFVFGFGKTGITVEAGPAIATAEGTVLLFFVLGVS